MSTDQAGTGLAIDHVALPLRHTAAMIAFYRSLGLAVDENPFLVQVHLGDQMINFHQPGLWQGDFRSGPPWPFPPAVTCASSGPDRPTPWRRRSTGPVPASSRDRWSGWEGVVWPARASMSATPMATCSSS